MCTHPPCLAGVRGRELWLGLGLGRGEGSGAQDLGGDGRKEGVEEDKKRGGGGGWEEGQGYQQVCELKKIL